MRKRATIAENPLDSIIPAARSAESRPERGGEGSFPIAQVPVKVSKERLTVHLPVDLIDRVKNVVYWTPGLTLAGFAEEAFAAVLESREAERGEPYPPRREELKGGRPMK